MTRTSRIGKSATFLTISALGAGLLSGCDQGSEASRAIDEASRAIDSIAAGGGSSMEPAYAIEKFEDAKSALDRSSLDGTGAEKAGVMVLKARSGVGLAVAKSVGTTDENAMPLGELERQAAAQAMQIRSVLRTWEEQNALADAAGSYDSTAELSELDAAASDVRDRMADVQTEKQQVDAKIAEMRGQIEQLQQQAKVDREKAAELELRAAGMTAIEAAKIAPEIQQHALAAEKKLFEVSRLEARLSHVQTSATEAAVTVEKFQQQLELNNQSREEVGRLEAEARREAEAARANAREAAATVRNLTEKLLAFRAGTDGGGLEPAAEEQISMLRDAVRNAGQAASEMKVSAKAAAGSANAVLGDALSRRARSLEDLASLLERIATASPAVPDASWYAEHAKEAREQAGEAAAAAKEAYDAASNAFASVGGRGETADLLNQLSDRLRESAGGGPASEDEPSGGDASADQDEG